MSIIAQVEGSGTGSASGAAVAKAKSPREFGVAKKAWRSPCSISVIPNDLVQIVDGGRGCRSAHCCGSVRVRWIVVKWPFCVEISVTVARAIEIGTDKLAGVLGRLEQRRCRLEQPRDPRSMGLFRRLVREALPKIAVENGGPNLKQKMSAPL